MIVEANDGDVEDIISIQNLFDQKCELLQQKQLSHSDYILHIDGTCNKADVNIAAVDSGSSIALFKLSDDLHKLDTLEKFQNIVSIKFSNENDNLIYIATVNGRIELCDLRTKNKVVSQFIDASLKSPNFRPLSCFDVSSNSKLICAGTELYEGDAFILFWDVRKTIFLGGYWESHMNDITQVKFHSEDPNNLVSGSVDGFINIYDLSQSNEYDALVDTLNTESSVENILRYKEDNKDHICCSTFTSDIQLWRMQDGELCKAFSRSDITQTIRRTSASYCYVASTYKDSQNAAHIIVGSKWGNGESIRTVKVNNNKLVPAAILPGNKQIIRSSWYNSLENILVTGGENGILNVWKL